MLYPAELLGHGAGEENRTLDQSLEGSCFTTKLHPRGREDRIWTCDPLVPNQVLYQAEPLPVIGAPERSRTPNLLIRSQTLYPIELRALIHDVFSSLYFGDSIILSYYIFKCKYFF